MGFHSGSGVGDGCSVEMTTRKSVPPTLPLHKRVAKLELQVEELTSRLLKTCEMVFKLTGGQDAG
jgi:hypothetical protein